jgi:hypothetical protein
MALAAGGCKIDSGANAMTMSVAIWSRAADTPNFRMLSPM